MDDPRTYDGGQVFPSHGYGRRGMTYRQWLVGQILAGLCANPRYCTDAAGVLRYDPVPDALRLADAAIRLQREEAPEP
jgi:hypothetical protein